MRKIFGVKHDLVPLYCLLALVFTTCSWAQGNLNVLHNFGGSGDGYHPYGAMIFDNNGNLYGTAEDGPGTGCGGQGCGTVFELKPNSDGTWTEDVVQFFNGADGSNPVAGPVFDHRRNLYGTTYAGGSAGFGTVFRLTPTSGGAWTLSTLYTFASVAVGAYPVGGVSFDDAGRLYGTTESGGPYTDGIVYNLGPISVFNWHEILAHAFSGGSDGAVPYSSLIFDDSGTGYGTTNQGGANGVGTVFKLTPNELSFGWTETVLYSFTGELCAASIDGAASVAGLTFDSAGNLYGTTLCGGPSAHGTVFMLTHNGDSWTESVIYSFPGSEDGNGPYAGVIFDAGGNLLGTTCSGGQGYGILYKLTPSNGQWAETILHNFSYGDGACPSSSVALDSGGNLYGTTLSGGTYGPYGGVAYEFTPYTVPEVSGGASTRWRNGGVNR